MREIDIMAHKLSHMLDMDIVTQREYMSNISSDIDSIIELVANPNDINSVITKALGALHEASSFYFEDDTEQVIEILETMKNDIAEAL